MERDKMENTFEREKWYNGLVLEKIYLWYNMKNFEKKLAFKDISLMFQNHDESIEFYTKLQLFQTKIELGQYRRWKMHCLNWIDLTN